MPAPLFMFKLLFILPKKIDYLFKFIYNISNYN